MADSGKRISSIGVQLPIDLGILLARAIVHHEEHVALQHPYMDVRCPAERALHLPDSSRGLPKLYNEAGTAYFTLKKYQRRFRHRV